MLGGSPLAAAPLAAGSGTAPVLARVVQAFAETVGADANPPVQVGQAYAEAVFSVAPSTAAQVFVMA